MNRSVMSRMLLLENMNSSSTRLLQINEIMGQKDMPLTFFLPIHYDYLVPAKICTEFEHANKINIILRG